MSIRDDVAKHLASGELEAYRPRSRKPARRRLFLTKGALKELNNPNSAVRLLGGHGPIEAAMTKWVNGERIYGSWKGGVLKCAFLCRLDAPPPEVWEIRVTEPLVRWRIFGRFGAPDTLIVTSMRTRTLLGKRGSSGWTSAMADCVQVWETLFPSDPPFTGNRASDYITENCDDFEL